MTWTGRQRRDAPRLPSESAQGVEGGRSPLRARQVAASVPSRGAPALQSNGSTDDQHMPSESSLECGEHLWPHGLEPRLQFILIVDVLFDDVGENMRLCPGDHIKQ